MIRRAAVLAILALAAFAASAQADNVITVNSQVDAPLAPSATTCTSTLADGSCTLRAATELANEARGQHTTINVPAGTYPLTFQVQPTTPSISTPTGRSELFVSGNVTIIGTAGAAQTIVDGQGTDRVFFIYGGPVTITGLTIQNGNPGAFAQPEPTPAHPAVRRALSAPACATENPVSQQEPWGGGIYNDNAALTLDADVITANTAVGAGGGIWSDGQLSLYHTTVSNNQACEEGDDYASGGGIDLASRPQAFTPAVEQKLYTPQVTIDSSTISANTAVGANGYGGGINDETDYSDDDAPLVVNSTVANNVAGDEGGGLVESWNTMTLLNDTLSANTAQGQQDDCASDSGGCGGNLLGTCDEVCGGFEYADTIIAGGVSGESGVGSGPTLNDCGTDSGQKDSYDSLGYNLDDLPAGSGPDACDLSTSSNDLVATDPKLDPNGLAVNGGPNLPNPTPPAQTIALENGSPAIDAIPPSACVLPSNTGINPLAAPSLGSSGAVAVDERGVTRPQNANCDIGAFEATTDMSVTSNPSNPSIGVGQSDTVTDTVTNNGNDTGSGVTLNDPGAGFTITGATASQGTCTFTATTVTCNLGSVPAGASVTVTITLTATSAGTITLTASTGAGETDPNLANNTSTATINVAAPAPPRVVVSASAPCTSVRDFPIHIQNVKQFHIVKAKVYLNGRLNKTLTGHALTAPVNLKNLPFGTFTVKITAYTRSGKVIHYQRVYHTCRLKPLPGHKHLVLGARG
jgi:hypothetical protein